MLGSAGCFAGGAALKHIEATEFQIEAGWRKAGDKKAGQVDLDIGGRAPGSTAPWQTFEHLRSGACKWPAGETKDGRVLFCAEVVADYKLAGTGAHSYCRHHALMGRYRPRAGQRIDMAWILSDLARLDRRIEKTSAETNA